MANQFDIPDPYEVPTISDSGVDEDIQPIQDWLKKNKPRPKKEEEEESAFQGTRFAETVKRAKKQAKQRREEEDIISSKMLYSPTPAHTLEPGVISAKHLGWDQPNEKGELPAGVDLRSLPEEQAQRLFGRLSPEEQETLLAQWEAQMGER